MNSFFLMLAVTGFFLVSVWVKELLSIGFGLLLSKPLGFNLKTISLFGLHLDKRDGKWEATKGKPSFLISHNTSVDISKPVPEDIDRREKLFEGLRLAGMFLISGAVVLLCRGSISRCFSQSGSPADWFLAGFSVGLLWHTVVMLGIRIYVYGFMMRSLLGYTQTLTKRLRAGESFSAMGLRPVEELPYPNAKPMEKMLYYCYYLNACLEQGNIGAMQKPTREMTAYFRDQDYVTTYLWNYSWLVYYYSRYELNPAAATHFMNKIRPQLEADQDANAKRILAYYAFGVEQDFPKARALLDQAAAAVDTYSLGAEREIERRLIADLDGYLRRQGY